MKNTKKINIKNKKTQRKNKKKSAGAITNDCSKDEGSYTDMHNLKYSRRPKDIKDSIYFLDILNNKTQMEYRSIEMEMSQWKFSDEQIRKFNSVLNRSETPMDCVINAGQLIGILTDRESNLLRLSCASKNGISAESIIRIFTYVTRHVDGNYKGNEEVEYSNSYIFDFNPGYSASCIEQWFKEIEKQLKNGHIMFAGWKDDTLSQGHVFCFAKTLDGRIYLLDPQQNNVPISCRKGSNGKLKCADYIIRGQTAYRMYYILYSSTQHIPKNMEKDLLEGLGFEISLGKKINKILTKVKDSEKVQESLVEEYMRLSVKQLKRMCAEKTPPLDISKLVEKIEIVNLLAASEADNTVDSEADNSVDSEADNSVDSDPDYMEVDDL